MPSPSAPKTATAEAKLVGHWSWSVGQVTVTPYDGGPDITTNTGNFHVDLIPISDPGQPDDGKIDDTNPAAKFTGTFFLSGYYAIPVTASVHFVDSVTGADAGTYSNTDYVGDSMDNPAYDPTQDYSGTTSPNSAALPVTGNWPTSTVSASPYGTIVPPPPPPLPAKRVASDILAGLPHPIKLGLYSKYHFTEKYTVAVQPKFKVGDVSFAISSGVASLTATPEMARSAKGQQVQTGNVILVLTAKLPSKDPNGELMIATRVSTNKAIGSANVLVLEPHFLDPKPSFNSSVTGINEAENSNTSPGDVSITAPSVSISKFYGTFLTMHVRDQFTQSLDPIFVGTDVSEHIDATSTSAAFGGSINSPISGGGIYTDPVGLEQKAAKFVIDINSPFAREWTANGGTYPSQADIDTFGPSFPTTKAGVDAPFNLSPASQSVVQTIHVSVGGHELTPNPAVHRRISTSPLSPPQPGKVTLKIEPL